MMRSNDCLEWLEGAKMPTVQKFGLKHFAHCLFTPDQFVRKPSRGGIPGPRGASDVAATVSLRRLGRETRAGGGTLPHPGGRLRKRTASDARTSDDIGPSFGDGTVFAMHHEQAPVSRHRIERSLQRRVPGLVRSQGRRPPFLSQHPVVFLFGEMESFRLRLHGARTLCNWRASKPSARPMPVLLFQAL